MWMAEYIIDYLLQYGFLLPFVLLPLPVLAIILSHRRKIRNKKIEELELQKEILELEIKKQDNAILLLAEEHRKLDRIINQ